MGKTPLTFSLVQIKRLKHCVVIQIADEAPMQMLGNVCGRAVVKNYDIMRQFVSVGDNRREESIGGQVQEYGLLQKERLTILSTYIDRALPAKTDNRPDLRRMIRDVAKELPILDMNKPVYPQCDKRARALWFSF